MHVRTEVVACSLAVTVVAVSPPAAAGLVIRSDHRWIQSDCLGEWSAADIDDSAWPRALFPYVQMWQRDWPLDPEARPMWGSHFNSCVRRHFALEAAPEQATLHIWVDDDYELYINGEFVGRSADGYGAMPGETYDVARHLRAGDNVLALALKDCVGEFRGALVSLSIPGAPDEPTTWLSAFFALREWAVFAAVILAALAVVVAVRWLRRRLQTPLSRCPPRALAVFILALAVATQWSFQAHPFYPWAIGQPILPWNWPQLALALGLLATLAVALGVRGRGATSGVPVRNEIVAIAAILLVAVVFRVAYIETAPPGFFQDEAINGLDALQLWERPSLELWSDSIGGRPTLFLYVLGAALKLFGTSYLALKVVPVTCGVLSVAALYMVGRAAIGPRAALWAALLFAVSRWHVHFSRMAWEVNCVPLFSALGFALFLRGLERERRGDLSLAAGGAVLALGIYSYAAYRAVVAVVVVFVLATLISRDRRILRERAVGLILAAAAAMAVAAPLAHFAWTEPQLYWTRYSDVSLTAYMAYHGTPVPWLYTFGRALLSLNHRGDLDAGPFLDPLTAMLVLAGVSAATLREHQRGLRLVWCWLLTFAALASLTKDSPHATRMLGMLPPAILLAGHGASRLVDLFRAGWTASRLPAAANGLAVALAMVLNAYLYFAVQQQEPEVDLRMNEGARILCEELAAREGEKRFWTDEVAYNCKAQCVFLLGGRWENMPEGIGVEDLVDTSRLLAQPRPVAVIFGRRALEDAAGRIPIDVNGNPVVGLPARPRVLLTREGKPLYFIYRF